METTRSYTGNTTYQKLSNVSVAADNSIQIFSNFTLINLTSSSLIGRLTYVIEPKSSIHLFSLNTSNGNQTYQTIIPIAVESFKSFTGTHNNNSYKGNIEKLCFGLKECEENYNFSSNVLFKISITFENVIADTVSITCISSDTIEHFGILYGELTNGLNPNLKFSSHSNGKFSINNKSKIEGNIFNVSFNELKESDVILYKRDNVTKNTYTKNLPEFIIQNFTNLNRPYKTLKLNFSLVQKPTKQHENILLCSPGRSSISIADIEYDRKNTLSSIKCDVQISNQLLTIEEQPKPSRTELCNSLVFPTPAISAIIITIIVFLLLVIYKEKVLRIAAIFPTAYCSYVSIMNFQPSGIVTAMALFFSYFWTVSFALLAFYLVPEEVQAYNVQRTNLSIISYISAVLMIVLTSIYGVTVKAQYNIFGTKDGTIYRFINNLINPNYFTGEVVSVVFLGISTCYPDNVKYAHTYCIIQIFVVFKAVILVLFTWILKKCKGSQVTSVGESPSINDNKAPSNEEDSSEKEGDVLNEPNDPILGPQYPEASAEGTNTNKKGGFRFYKNTVSGSNLT